MPKDHNTGRIIDKTVTFENNKGIGHALEDAKHYLRRIGYSFGPMCGNMPIVISNSDEICYIAKWRNIDRDEMYKLDGIIVFLDRDEDAIEFVKILFFKKV